MSELQSPAASTQLGANRITVPTSQETPMLTGAVLPTDMRVRLIRADSSAFDTILTVLFSITLTLFGVFVGSWITDPTQMPKLAKVATVAFGLLSVALIIWWVVIKVCQMKKGVTVPLGMIEGLRQ